MLTYLGALASLTPRAHRGQGIVEYGLLIVLVAIAVITLLGLLGGQVASVYNRILTSIA
jgi:Flp pilus assembly pilin Flp